jgi:hypothetical protein
MSSGLAAPVPQIPRPGHDLFDADSWPARQLETAQARLQSVQAVLKNFSYTMTKDASGTSTQSKKTAGTYPRPLSITNVGNYETDIDNALTAVTTAIGALREALAD